MDENKRLLPYIEAKKIEQIFIRVGERAFAAYNAELLQLRAKNAELVAWAKAAYPSVTFTADVYDWPGAKALIENAPDGVKPGENK